VAVAAYHEGTKDREDHALRVSSILREKPWSLAFVAALGLVACGRTPPATPPPPSKAVPATHAPVGNPVPHGDHNPHHGGVVMLEGEDLDYEVVLDATGRDHRVYFTDAVRDDLPASVATDVVLTIKRRSASNEIVGMQIDDAGESWVGRSRPVAEPAA